jgi:ATP-dependent Lhr-like helicase
MTRELLDLPRPVAFTKLTEQHSLDSNAAENLLQYLEEQKIATEKIPSDKDIVIEICRDDLGDRRVCVLTPFGSRVHAPWCIAVTAKLRSERGWEVESMWSDDGFVIRLPENEEPIDSSLLIPAPAEFRDLVIRQLGSTSLFAAKFREAAARALLLPRRRAGLRTPLWQQRKRAADLLTVASRYSSFPILLEAYRECIRDVFDLPVAAGILAKIQQGGIGVKMVESRNPSPFASSLLFSYVANYIYEGDAPLAERRAQALSIDQSQLEELFGDVDLRELLDSAALDEVEAKLQSLEPDYQARHADGVHDLLLKLGDLCESELAARSANPEIAAMVHELVNTRRAVRVRIATETRFVPVEYASRYRDALGTPLPPGLPEVFLQNAGEPLAEITRRFARTHGPFLAEDLAKRYGMQISAVEPILRSLHAQGKLLEGEFRPNGRHREWCDPDVLQQIRRKSMARLRREIEPVEQNTFARFATRWQGVTVPRRGLDALLDTVESMQGVAVLASELEREILPQRISDYRQGDLDTLMAAGEIVWLGVEPLGERDGRIALYLTESLSLLMPPKEIQTTRSDPSDRAKQIGDFLAHHGASFFAAIHAACGGGFPGESLDALWELVWSGQITNDTFQPLRNLTRPPDRERNRPVFADDRPGSPEFLRRLRTRGSGSGRAQGRWSLVQQRIATALTPTQWTANISRQLLIHNGIVSRETALAENIPGGYNTVYPALKTMEENGLTRRGMFVAGLGAAQFAMPAAVDMLRSLRLEPASAEIIYLAATDPANPYGTILPWPRVADEETNLPMHHAMARTAGAGVILINGNLAAFMRRRNPAIRVFLLESEPERSSFARELAKKLAELAVRRQTRNSGLLLGTINDQPAREHFLASFLEDAGFVNTVLGFQMRRARPTGAPALQEEPLDNVEDDDEPEISETA